MKFLKIVSVVLILVGIALTLSINIFADEIQVSKYRISGFPYGINVNSLYTAVDPESQWSGIIDSPLKTVGVYPFVRQNGQTVALGIDTTVGWQGSSQRNGKDLVVEYTFKGAWIDTPNDPNFGSFTPLDLRLIFYCSNLPISGLTISVNDNELEFTTQALPAHSYVNYKKIDPTNLTGWDTDSTGDFIVYKGFAPNGNYYETDSSNDPYSYYGFTFWVPWTSRYQVWSIKFVWEKVFPDQIGSFQLPSQTSKAMDLTVSLIQGLYTLTLPLLTCTGFMLFGLAIKKIYSHG